MRAEHAIMRFSSKTKEILQHRLAGNGVRSTNTIRSEILRFQYYTQDSTVAGPLRPPVDISGRKFNLSIENALLRIKEEERVEEGGKIKE